MPGVLDGAMTDAPSLETPTVSIIMVTYNRAKTLRRAIDSVLAQDFPRWELIVVDDGSHDETDEVLARYDERESWSCATRRTVG